MKMNRMTVFLAATSLLLVSWASASLSSANSPKVSAIWAQTDENQGIYGDAIKVLFSTAMHPNSSSTENQIAATPPSQANGNLNPARNYTLKITPGPHSNTQSYQGTWADLGGKAVYDENDPNKQMVLLYLPDHAANKNIYAPGDTIEVTVTSSVRDAANQELDTQENKTSRVAS